MAKNNVHQLLADAQTREDLQKMFDGVTDVSEITRLAGEAGYEFTADEFREGSAEFYEEHEVELSDEMLEAVAGGVCSSSIIIIINK
jgi:predicted ribosomally synthesized peptide with nif11-like leader